MRCRLPVALKPALRETPLDYLSRLSFRNGRDGVRAICTDFGLRPIDVANGDPAALAAVEALGGAEPGTLSEHAFRPVGERGRIAHCGEILHRAMLSRYRVRVCPACVRRDADEGRGRLEARPWRRSEWLLRDMRTCAEHALSLADLDDRRDPKLPDFSRTVAGVVGDIGSLDALARHQPASGLERYLLHRLHGAPSPNPRVAEVMGELPLYACIRLSEVLGAVALDGPDAAMAGLPEAVLHERQAAGFDVAAAGRASIEDLLDRLRDGRGRRSGQAGPQALFGCLYLWLAHQSRDPAYDPIRDIVRNRCLATVALRPGGTVSPFGETVSVRRLHSVRSAAIEYGINPVTLRKALPAAGVVAASRRREPTSRTTR